MKMGIFLHLFLLLIGFFGYSCTHEDDGFTFDPPNELIEPQKQLLNPCIKDLTLKNAILVFTIEDKWARKQTVLEKLIKESLEVPKSALKVLPLNNKEKNKNFTWSIHVPIECNQNLQTARIIWNFNIFYVNGLNILDWQFNSLTKRNRRQAVDDIGSGDYEDEYYDENYDDEDDADEDLGDVENNPPTISGINISPSISSSSSTSSSSSSTSTSVPSSSSTQHPHRHHHGENKSDNAVVSSTKKVTTEKQIPLEEVEVEDPTKLTNFDPLDFDPHYDYDAYDGEDDNDDEEEDPLESSTLIVDNNNSDDFITELPKVESSSISSSSTTSATTSTTTTTTPAPKTTTTTSTTEIPFTTEEQEIIVETTDLPLPITIIEIPSSTTTPAAVPVTELATTSTEQEIILSTKLVTETVPALMTTEEETTEKSVETTTTEIPTTTTTTTTELAPPASSSTSAKPKNTKPYIENRLQPKSVTAGKVFRFIIPTETFRDAEDGHNLTVAVFDANNMPISRSSWLQFNGARRELYGLPLAEDVSNWVYKIRAYDHHGEFEDDQLTVQVQQHRLERVTNHEFVMDMRIEKPQEYEHYVDWCLKVLRVLGKVFGTNMQEITVRKVNFGDQISFIWSNDSLPTNYCARTEINDIFKMLTANDRGDPSRELSQLLRPDIRVKKVFNKDLSICEQQLPPPAVPVTPIITTTNNFSPILRNPVDKVNGTVGELLIYKVKDDTFYDPEDVDSTSLNITLLTADFAQIPANSWLQFDTKNREFYGIPRKSGRTEYFLICVDSGGMSAKDSLEVVVQQPATKTFNVEFSMTIGVSLDVFSNNAAIQRKFVEKLMEIFEESTPNNFHFLPFREKRDIESSTVVSWFNKSLPMDQCPIDEIKRLEKKLHSESRSISSRVHRIMAPEFTVSTIKVHHAGNCKAKTPQIIVPPTITTLISPPPPRPEIFVPNTEDEAAAESPRSPSAEEKENNDLMITLILPIVIILIMLVIAFLAACILYRKRKMGKMNVEEDAHGHHQSAYGNKGIPVIFQEELEEKPESGTKAPVILKDEKPPLAPPEYHSRSGSVKLEDSSSANANSAEPYQPPPPFPRSHQDNGGGGGGGGGGKYPHHHHLHRPKPTPTYRKPPPYVPP